MFRRIMGATFVALLVVSVAVTPLSAVVQPGDFELPIQSFGCPGGNRQATAVLHDETGMVQGLTFSMPSGEHQLAPTRTLLVDWEGDSAVTSIVMEFSAPNGRYRLDMRTMSDRCPIGTGLGLTFELLLRAPVDPALVDVVHE